MPGKIGKHTRAQHAQEQNVRAKHAGAKFVSPKAWSQFPLWAKILSIVVALALVAMAGFFIISKKSDPVLTLVSPVDLESTTDVANTNSDSAANTNSDSAASTNADSAASTNADSAANADSDNAESDNAGDAAINPTESVADIMRSGPISDGTGTMIDDATILAYLNGLIGYQSGCGGLCQTFVANVWQSLGATRSSTCCANNYGDWIITSNSMNDIPIGADVFFSPCSTDGPCEDCGWWCYGHVGIYVGNGYFVHVLGNGIVIKTPLAGYWSTQWRGWGVHGNVILHNHDWSIVTETTHACSCGVSGDHTFVRSGIDEVCSSCGAMSVCASMGVYYAVAKLPVYDAPSGTATGKSIKQIALVEIDDVQCVDGVYWGHVCDGGSAGWIRMAGLRHNGTAGVHRYLGGTCVLCGSARVATEPGTYRTALDTMMYAGNAYSDNIKTVAQGTLVTIQSVSASNPENDWWGFTEDGYVINMSQLERKPVSSGPWYEKMVDAIVGLFD